MNGIAVDTLSLDFGPSVDFAVHFSWLPDNRWGLENVANLDKVPLAFLAPLRENTFSISE